MKAKFSLYAKHIVLCLAFLFLPYAFTSTNTIFSLPHLYTNAHDRIYFFIYFTLLCFFYFNYYYLIPKLYFTDKKLVYYGIIAIFLLFFLWISTVLDHPSRNFLDFRDQPVHFTNMHRISPDGFRPPPQMEREMPFEFKGGPPTQYSHTTLVYLIGVISSLLFAISGRLQSVEEEKVKSELAFLKAQINPHFLFNTLNSIYALALKKDNKTPDAVIQLSELMRYIMTNSNDEVIDLPKEINYINNFISLQKTRLGNTVIVDYKVTGNSFGKQITPLILISFIENAFKYGVNPDQTSEICISIDIKEDQLILWVSNKKIDSVYSESGIGLQNTIKRLKLVYPNRHQLKIIDTPDKYTVNLSIKLA
ncbi:sensor histidine kinase [Flavobacterium branchiicola]|uniref:Sensor histidine kinase n=1 Tax=Flavobacterium branchiicola TaxID=1114875 RepID=A0ABV9PFI4_9FLAO|nr:sensor histidine kinase [Flavobacterium branchiicola]MBS7255248.1 sensor histidine kinase [Flavobacterium branchiicola]